MAANLNSATADANIFGLTLLGSGAVIKKMPLLNIFRLNGNTHPVVAAICDCSNHFLRAGKKDALFILDVFGAVLIDFEPDKNETDIFMLMGRPTYKWPERCLRLISPGP